MDQLRNTNSGFSTLELLIAMTILMMVLSAVILVTFGNQSLITDSETSKESLNKAEELLEHEQALARKDFKLVNPRGTVADNIYQKTLSISNIDFFTKKVTSAITWAGGHGRALHTDLTTLVTNFDNSTGGDTCYSNLTGNWTNPQIESTIDFSSISPAGRYTISDVNAYKNKLYVTASRALDVVNPTNVTLPTFFVFNINDPSNPTLTGSADNAETVTSGLNAVSVAEDQATGKVFAYTASDTSSNYSSCSPVNPVTGALDPACGQFYVFDVTNANPVRKANLKLNSSPAVTGQTTGTSIFYRDGYLFLGLEKTSGPEFHILDVHKPNVISSGSFAPTSSLEIDHGVNSIFSRDNYAYLAIVNNVTADMDLRIVDISSPNNPNPGPISNPYGFNSATGGGNGKSLYLVGDRMYLGKTTQAGKDLYVLNGRVPGSTLSEIGGVDVASSLNAIIVRSNLAFLLTNSDLKIFDIWDPENALPFTISSPLASLALPVSGNAEEPSMDCEGNRLYISSNNSSGQGYVYVIKPGP